MTNDWRFSGGGTNLRDDATGQYRWGDTLFPSVTTVLKMLHKDALVPWASKAVAEYVNSNFVAFKNKEITGQELAGVIGDVNVMKSVPFQQRDDKADIGTNVHKAAEMTARGESVALDDFPAETHGYINSYLTWFNKYKPEYLALELPLFNKTYNYAGTMDSVVKMNGRTLILDYKTSKDSYNSHALQLAAYRYAEFIGVNGEEYPVFDTEGGVILLIGEDKCQLKEWKCDEEEFKIFCDLREIYGWEAKKYKAKILK